MDKSLTIYINKEQLVKAAGVKYEQILKDLVDEGLLEDYTVIIKLTFDKSKALHLQSVLEFYEVKDVPEYNKKRNNNSED